MTVDLDLVRVGAKFRKPGILGGNLWHVRAIVDGDQVVIRAWSRKLGWMYRVEWIASVAEWIEQDKANGGVVIKIAQKGAE